MIDLVTLEGQILELRHEVNRLNVAHTIHRDLEDFLNKVIPSIARAREQRR